MHGGQRAPFTAGIGPGGSVNTARGANQYSTQQAQHSEVQSYTNKRKEAQHLNRTPKHIDR